MSDLAIPSTSYSRCGCVVSDQAGVPCLITCTPHTSLVQAVHSNDILQRHCSVCEEPCDPPTRGVKRTLREVGLPAGSSACAKCIDSFTNRPFSHRVKRSVIRHPQSDRDTVTFRYSVTKPPPPVDLTRYGVEPNPGPIPLAAIAAAASSIASIASTVKKSKTIKKSAKKPTSRSKNMSSLNLRDSSRVVMAPVSRNYLRSGSHKTAAFSFPFSSQVANLVYNPGQGGLQVQNPTGPTLTNSTFTANPIWIGPGSTISNILFANLFNKPINALAVCFTEWRLRNLKISFIPTKSSTTSGLVAGAWFSDSSTLGATTAPTIGSVMISPYAKSGPVWTPFDINVPDSAVTGGRDGWLYTDLNLTDGSTNTTADEAELRQVCYGQTMFAIAGVDTSVYTTATTFGMICLSGDICLRNLADSTTF